MKRAYQQLAIVALFGLVAVVMSLPAATNMTSHIIGEGGDPWQTLWRFEYKYEALLSAAGDGALLEFVRNEFWGRGEARLVNLSVWSWMPVYALLGNPQAYNVIWLVSFALSGYAMYLLARWLLGEYGQKDAVMSRETGAIIAGIYYQLLPFHVAHAYGHFGAMQLQWLPILVLLLLLTLKQPTTWRTVGFVVVATLQVWTEHHYALWFALAAIVLLIWKRARLAVLARSTAFRYQVLLAIALLVAVTLPSMWPTVQLAAASNDLALGMAQTVRFSADLFSFVVPAPFHSAL